VTTILVTHDREEAFSLADRIAVMHEGAIVQAVAPEELYFQPATRWVAEFVGAANVVAGRAAGGVVETALGQFAADCGNGHAPVEVVVRPELLELRPDPHGSGEVVSREFRGHDVFYRVRLQDGTEVCSQRPSTERVALGDRVDVVPHDGRVAVFSTDRSL
jgi:ABC-type Fe3+/spermidine/putrescine transport system ATPase subunit